MSETIPELILVTVAFLVAGLVKGVIGMGLPTVAVGVLSLGMMPAQAAALLVVPSLVTNIWQIWTGRRFGAVVRRLWPLLLGTCLGTWLGTLLFTPGATRGGEAALGAALVFYGLLGLSSVPMRVRPSHEPWLGPAAGLLTGVVTVVTNVFVLPNVPYLSALAWDRDELVQALGVSFTVSTLALGASLFAAGVLVPAAAGASAFAILPAVAGMYLGQIVRERVSARTFRLFFFWGILALGAHLLLRGLA